MPTAMRATGTTTGSVAARWPFTETSQYLGSLRPGYPKFYSMADLSTQTRRRWVPLTEAVSGGRVEMMYRRYAEESGNDLYAVRLVASAFIHGVVGRSMASFVGLGRVWDTGAENLSVRTDIDGGLDWAGVNDTSLRILPGDPAARSPESQTLPCEEALAQWSACRSRGTLDPIFRHLVALSGCPMSALWATVGEHVLGVATLVPTYADTSSAVAYRRGQLVIDALHTAGLPVRSRSSLPTSPGSGAAPERVGLAS